MIIIILLDLRCRHGKGSAGVYWRKNTRADTDSAFLVSGTGKMPVQTRVGVDWCLPPDGPHRDFVASLRHLCRLRRDEIPLPGVALSLGHRRQSKRRGGRTAICLQPQPYKCGRLTVPTEISSLRSDISAACGGLAKEESLHSSELDAGSLSFAVGTRFENISKYQSGDYILVI